MKYENKDRVDELYTKIRRAEELLKEFNKETLSVRVMGPAGFFILELEQNHPTAKKFLLEVKSQVEADKGVMLAELDTL